MTKAYWIDEQADKGKEIIDTVGTVTMHLLVDDCKSHLLSIQIDKGSETAFNTAYWAGIAEGYYLRREVEKDVVLRDWI